MATKVKKYKPDTVRAAFSQWFVGEESPDGEQRSFCPICEDEKTSKSPSAMLNPEEGVWNCLKGNHGGSIYELARDLKKNRGWDIRSAAMTAKNAQEEFASKRDAGLTASGRRAAPLPSADTIARWNTNLLRTKTALKDIQSERGFDKRTLIDHEIGWDGQRYTIPIYDEDGELCNVRRYRLKAGPHNDKMLNLPGHGTARIYGIEEIEEYDNIIITEGETDRLLLKQALREGGFTNYGVITHTAGAATFRPQWGPLLRDKNVWFCYDNDDGGKNGSKKAIEIVEPYAEAVYNMVVPLKDKGADITDYLHKEGYTISDFMELMEEATTKTLAGKRDLPIADSGEHMSLTESMSEDNQSKTIEMVVSVSGKQAEPYTAPKTIHANCDVSKGAACTMCPIGFADGQKTVEVRIDNPEIFRFVDSTEDRRNKLLRELTGARCSDRVEFEVPGNYHVEELLVQPSVDDRTDGESQQPIKRTVFSVGTYRSGVNEKVRLVGRNVPDPKNGKLRFMSWDNKRVELDIDKFKLDDEMRNRLEAFRPDEDQMPLDKCIEIAQDMSANVTHIYGRDILHVAYDLVYHSVLSFKYFDVPVEKGWLEMMVVGDTRTGKSEIAKQLISHYKAGSLLSCEGMTFAGIVGGVQQIDGRWHMTWGAVPMNDRRMMFLDEASGLADKNVIEQMSSIRSSGIAQITKISAEQTSARTRLVWIANPADGSMLADHQDQGMSALRSVVPNNEDIARFDFVCAAARGEVDDALINGLIAEKHSPRYSAEDCESLVKWVWSLTRDDVMISKSAIRAAAKAASQIGGEYIPDPPLIQSENVRYKILRIACALAARTFSADKAGKLRVSLEHVEDAVRFLNMVYDQEAMGYRRKSRRRIRAQEMAARRRAAVKGWLLEHDQILHTLRLVGGTTFRVRDFREFASMSDEDAQQAVVQLIEHKMVQRKSRGDMTMETELISILREIEDEEEEQ